MSMKKLMSVLVTAAIILQLSACTVNDPGPESDVSDPSSVTDSSSEDISGGTSEPHVTGDISEIWGILPELAASPEAEFK